MLFRVAGHDLWLTNERRILNLNNWLCFQRKRVTLVGHPTLHNRSTWHLDGLLVDLGIGHHGWFLHREAAIRGFRVFVFQESTNMRDLHSRFADWPRCKCLGVFVSAGGTNASD